MGPLETELNKFMWDSFEGSPGMLDAALEGREAHDLMETVMIVLAITKAQKTCILRLAREIDDLSGA